MARAPQAEVYPRNVHVQTKSGRLLKLTGGSVGAGIRLAPGATATPCCANDIALLRTNEEVPLERYLRLAPDGGELPERLDVLGYGRTEEGRVSDRLLRGELRTMPAAECRKILPHAWVLDDFCAVGAGACMLRAGEERAWCADTCGGDSGGPLFTDDLALHGVVSRGDEECGTFVKRGDHFGPLPSIYTDVRNHMAFLEGDPFSTTHALGPAVSPAARLARAVSGLTLALVLIECIG